MSIFDKIFRKDESVTDKNDKKALKLEGVTEETLKEASNNKGED